MFFHNTEIDTYGMVRIAIKAAVGFEPTNNGFAIPRSVL